MSGAAYDPFARGPSPVGVRGDVMVDEARDGRRLPYELWYPAAPEHAGQDLDPRTQDAFTLLPDAPPLRQAAVRDAAPAEGRHPLVLFSHTSNGHRCQSSFLCTHLASHGYVVAAADHTGNTHAELAARQAAGVTRTPEEVEAYARRIVADRVPDVRCLHDRLLDGTAGGLADRIDAARVGVVGWSFGGWAALAVPETDDRVGAVVALAPAGASNPVPGVIPVRLGFAWPRPPPTLYLVAERDWWTPLDGMRELFVRTPAAKRMFVLRGADHGHFGDEIEDAPPDETELAHIFTRGLALAHLDAALKASRPAAAFLAGDPIAELRARGVDAFAHSGDD